MYEISVKLKFFKNIIYEIYTWNTSTTNYTLIEKNKLNMQFMQNKNNCLKLLELWNEFLYYLATFSIFIKKRINSYEF